MLRKALVTNLFLISQIGWAAPIDKLAEELMSLRSEIETLHNELDLSKETYKSQVQSLNVAKADLTATNQREELKIKQLREQLAEGRTTLKEKFSGNTDLQGFVSQSATDLKTYIETSMPFKKDERLKEIDELVTKVEASQMSPYKAANKIWSFVEDELRLQKDIGIYKQVIQVAGEDQLCEVAKIGMLTYYFKTPGDQYGMVKKNGEQWDVVLLSETSEQAQIDELLLYLRNKSESAYSTCRALFN